MSSSHLKALEWRDLIRKTILQFDPVPNEIPRLDYDSNFKGQPVNEEDKET